VAREQPPGAKARTAGAVATAIPGGGPTRCGLAGGHWYASRSRASVRITVAIRPKWMRVRRRSCVDRVCTARTGRSSRPVDIRSLPANWISPLRTGGPAGWPCEAGMGAITT